MKKHIFVFLVLALTLMLTLCSCDSTDGLAVIDDNIYEISSAAGMMAFAEMVNEKEETFRGKTIYLSTDIDMSGIEWIPVGLYGSSAFCGTFDGKNHTISNLSVELGDGFYAAGLFGFVRGTVQNLTISHATVHIHAHGHNHELIPGSFGTISTSSGALAGFAMNGSVIQNVYIHGCDIVSGTYAGGVVGTVEGQLVDCEAEDVTLTAEETGTLYVNHEGHDH